MKVPGSDNTSNSNADGDSRVPWISKRVLGGKRGTFVSGCSKALMGQLQADRLWSQVCPSWIVTCRPGIQSLI
jgi:hypothetical protein